MEGGSDHGVSTERPAGRSLSSRPTLRAAADARQGRLPNRYGPGGPRQAFDARVEKALVPGARVLDVGAGRTPTVPVDRRPDGCHYVGLDISRAELDRAPAGAYDRVEVGDVVRRLPALEGDFDVVLSWQVLEHVRPLEVALENIRAYLRPGGRFVARLSGTFSAFGVANKLIPQRAGVWLLHRLLGRNPANVFPAYYDHCWDSALDRMLAPWSEREIVPEYFGAAYTRFSRHLTAAYILYEEWARRGDRRNLATHYVIAAVK